MRDAATAPRAIPFDLPVDKAQGRGEIKAMGLEGVEIVMKVEEAFEIAIEDAEAEKITTPRHLIDLVMGKVGRPDRAACLTQRAFHRLRASLLRSTRLARGEISPWLREAVSRRRSLRQRIRTGLNALSLLVCL